MKRRTGVISIKFSNEKTSYPLKLMKFQSEGTSGNMIGFACLALISGLSSGAAIAAIDYVDNDETVSSTQVSQWSSSNSLGIGLSNTASLTIENGGLVESTGQSTIGVSAAGSVTIKGQGSEWRNMPSGSEAFQVGGFGTGTLIVEGGGKLVTTGMSTLITTSAEGNVFVRGTGSVWLASDIAVGQSGPGSLLIEDGAFVLATSVLLGDGGSGLVTLNGTENSRGILQIDYLEKGLSASVVFDGGILKVNAATTNLFRNFSAGDITINNGGAFIDTNGYNVAITTADLLTGTGGLTKQGSGSLTISGGNTYSGNTTVAAGELHMDSYTQGSTTLGIGVTDDANYGKLVVAGTAILSSNANIRVDVVNPHTRTTLTNGGILSGILSAGTLQSDGTFNVTDNSTLFDFIASKNGNAVDLKIQAVSSTGVYDAVTDRGTFAGQGAAQVLDSAITNAVGGDMGNVVTALGSLNGNTAISRATMQTLPLLTGGGIQAVGGLLSSFNDIIRSRQTSIRGMSSGDAVRNQSVWFKTFGSRADQDDRSGTSGYKVSSWGMALGADGELDTQTRIGMAFSYAKSHVDGNLDLSGTLQRASIASHVLALYGSRTLASGFEIDLQGDVGLNTNDGSRHMSFGGLNRTAVSDYKTYTAHIGAGISKNLALSDRMTIMPGLRADYTWLRDKSYRETGADALNLDVQARTVDAFVLTGESRVAYKLSEEGTLTAHAGVGYDFINQRNSIVATYAGLPGQSFITQGINPSPWIGRAGAGYVHRTAGGTEITLRYDLEGKTSYLNQSASIKAKWAF